MADKKISALTAASTPLAGTEVLPIVQSGATVKVAVSDLTAGRVVSASGGTFKATTAYGTVSVDNTGTTGGGAFSVKQNGATSGIVGVSGWVKGDTTTNLALFSETGKSIEIFVNGDATAVGSFTTAGNYAPISGKGIDFSATSGTGTSELLDDYEEGTWTPTLAYSVSNGDLSYTAGYRNGSYTKVGNLVTVSFYLLFNETTASGNLSLTNLPFASASLTETFSAGGMFVANMAGFTGAPVWQVNQNGGTAMTFHDTTDGTSTTVTNSNTLAANNVLRLTAQYFAA